MPTLTKPLIFYLEELKNDTITTTEIFEESSQPGSSKIGPPKRHPCYSGPQAIVAEMRHHDVDQLSVEYRIIPSYALCMARDLLLKTARVEAHVNLIALSDGSSLLYCARYLRGCADINVA